MSGYPPTAGKEEGLDNTWGSLQSTQRSSLQLEPSYGYYNNNNGAGGNNNYYSSPPAQHAHGYHHPFVQSAMPTPQVPGPQPHHQSAIMSPVDTPQPRPGLGAPSNTDRTSSLLGLLKFSQPVGSPSGSLAAPIGTPLPPSREPSMSFNSGAGAASGHSRGPSDLLATLMGNLQPKPAQQLVPPIQAPFSSTGQSDATQSYLLNLLNKPKPSQVDIDYQAGRSNVFTPPSKNSTPTTGPDGAADVPAQSQDASLNLMGSSATENLSSFGIENNTSAPAKKLFTYNNPFDQLAATSPRNRTPKNALGPSNPPAFQILKNPRQESVEANPEGVLSPIHANRAMDTLPHVSGPPTPLTGGKLTFEALSGSSQKESVHQALDGVGNQADKQAREAIARAERDQNQANIEKDLRDLLSAHTDKEFKHAAQTAARDIKQELAKEENQDALDTLPAAVKEEVKEIIEEAAQGHIADSWESADAEESPSKEGEENVVKVYNFPMRPWTSITIKETDEPRASFRDDIVMDVARLRKEFDQVDRTLVTASNLFIAYGLSKAGLRIIRQDDGRDARLFTETNDRIFNVVLSVSQADLKEAVIGTGVNGTVYWGLVKDGEDDFIVDNNLDAHSFALPPLQSHDIESAGGVLKSRARKSSNHPEFFAVGRGKYIHIVWPSLVLKQALLKNGRDRVVDVEKYLTKQSLRLNTGKAGKDFTFSEDDTVIVSLDKAGKVKVWDVRSLTDLENASPTSVEIKDPLITFVTTTTSEKAWPTSVLFVDKLRPYQRGGALRYLIVGMKQNHILQLWDLALGKPVQEIHLPHTKESDAVCSVMYHAATGMIVVGHPTRNSVYFLHLSAPKYNLPKGLSQAQYIEKLVTSDTSIPKPDSTAVISGMREYSFANKGSLRSLDILQRSNQVIVDGEPITLFELYSMHSKGVTTVAIKQADLGWTVDNKVINAINADKAGVISIDLLKEVSAPPASEAGEVAPPPQTPTPNRAITRAASKESSQRDSPKKAKAAVPAAKVDEVAEKKEQAPSTPAPTSNREEKRKRKKANSSSATEAANTAQSGNEKAQSKPIVMDPSSHVRNGNAAKGNQNASVDASVRSSATEDGSLKTAADEVKKMFSDSFASLQSSIKNDRRTDKAVSDSKQETMLRLVSETLADNLQVTLSKIVNSEIRESVVPAVTAVAAKAVNDQLAGKLNEHVSQSIGSQLPRTLPDSISKALHQPQLLKLMADALAKSVAIKVEEQFTAVLQNSIAPAFTRLATETSRKIATESQQQASAQIAAFEQQQRADSAKIDQLTHLVASLTETLSSMAAAQSDFQAQILHSQQQQTPSDRRQGSSRADEQTPSRSQQGSTALIPVKTPEELEFESMLLRVDESMKAGEYEHAVIQWLQTGREQEFFEKYFSKLRPDFITRLSALLLLSLGATITAEMAGDLMELKMTWLEIVLNTFQSHIDARTLSLQELELIPRIMGIYTQRLEHMFMRISQISGAQDPTLRRFSNMVTQVTRILAQARDLVLASNVAPSIRSVH